MIAAALHLGAAALATRVGLQSSRRSWLPVAGGVSLLAAHSALLSIGAAAEPASGAELWRWSLSVGGAAALLLGLAGMDRTLRDRSASEGDQRRQADELEQTAQRLEMLFRFAPDALLLCATDGRVVDANESAENLSGLPRESLRGMHLGGLVTIVDSTVEATQARAAELLRAKTGRTYEYQVRTPDGRRRWLEIESQRIELEEGTYVLVSSRDVSERKNLEAQVREHETGLALILSRLPIHIWTTDHELRVTSAQGNLFRALNLEPGALAGRTIEEIFAGDPGRADTIERHRQALDGNLIRYMRHWRGRVLEGAMAAMPAVGDAPAEVIGVTLDVTEKVQAELEARSNELQLNEILDRAPVRVIIKNLELRATYANLEAERVSGLPRALWIGTKAADFLTEEEAQRIEANDRSVLAHGRAQTFVEDMWWKGKKRSFVTIRFPLWDSEGNAYSLCSLASEITERVRMEEELQRHTDLLSQAQSMAQLASWDWDVRSGQRHWSPQVYELVGIDPSMDAERSYDAFLASIVEEDRELVVSAMAAAIAEGTPYRIEHRIRLADGSLRWLLVQARTRRDGENKAWNVFGFVQDITERKLAADATTRLHEELEERVRQRAGELEYAIKELSSFSYAVSHDLRQPLRTIAGYMTLVEEDSGPSLQSATRERLDQVRAAVQRMDAMIRDLLALSRVSQSAIHRSELDFSTLVGDVADELFAAEPIRRVEWHIQEGLLAYADRSLLRVALQNLLSNALKFTRGKDPARIEIGCTRLGSEDQFFVADDGAGFDADAALRLFQPFQRMHDSAEFEGTGVGLATVARIVRRHGGSIRADSRKGTGATIYFTLPRTDEPAGPAIPGMNGAA